MADKTWVGFQGARARAFLKRSGNNWIRKRVWDWEFKHGKWDYLRAGGYDSFYELLVGRLSGGAMLDLGCGNGGVRCKLPQGALQRYVGIDYSSEALEQLRERVKDAPEIPGMLLVGDMTDRGLLKRSGADFDVVLLHECLNYVEAATIPDYLRFLCTLLNPGGVVMIRIWERNRYSEHVAAAEGALHVVERVVSETGPSIFLIADGPASPG